VIVTIVVLRENDRSTDCDPLDGRRHSTLRHRV
jgi:hypothetical protein